MARIGVVTTSYPRHAGRSRRQLRRARTSRALRALGHDVDVIAAGPAPTDDVTRRELAVLWRRCARCARASRLRERCARAPRLHGAPDRARSRGARATGTRSIAHWLVPSALAASRAPRRMPLLAIGTAATSTRCAACTCSARCCARCRRAARSSRSSATSCVALVRRAYWSTRDRPADGHRRRALRRARPRADARRRRRRSSRRLVLRSKASTSRSCAARHRASRIVIAGDGPERGARAHGDATTFIGGVDAAIAIAARDASVVVVPSRVLPNGRSEGTPTRRARGARGRCAGRRLGGRRPARAAGRCSSRPTIRARSPRRSIACSRAPPHAATWRVAIWTGRLRRARRIACAPGENEVSSTGSPHA